MLYPDLALDVDPTLIYLIYKIGFQPSLKKLAIAIKYFKLRDLNLLILYSKICSGGSCEVEYIH